MLASTPMARSLPKLAPHEASTVRIAVSRTGSLRQIRRRFSTRHSCGPARAVVSSCWSGLTHGQGITALHMAAQNGHLTVVKLLIARGADPSIKDDLYQSTPEGGAAYFGQVEVRDYLRSLGV